MPFAFSARHIRSSQRDQAAMLDHVGAEDLPDLLDKALPDEIKLRDPKELVDLPGSHSEAEVLEQLRQLGSKNRVYTSMIGQGYYDTITPSVIQRLVLEDPAWYTAYTPYQPEISQGRLEALLNFQTMVADLAGLDVAGSSMLDEGTAAAEAMLLSMRVSRRDRRFLVDRDRKSTRLNSSHVAISYAVFC